MNKSIIEKLKSITGADNIRINEDMSAHTSFRAGGRADIFVTPQDLQEAADIVRLLLADKVPYTVIGNGSNLLVSDSGYRGCIVCLGRGCDRITVDGEHITAGAGAMLSKVANTAYENSLAGMEFASGIPGCLGGAVVMNAGAYGGEMKDIITTVTMLDAVTQEIVTVDANNMHFGYRTSIVKEHPYVVLEAGLKLSSGNREEIKALMDDLAVRRRTKQPLEYPSAGSTFKRPPGNFAGKLIEDAGLKGFSVGGAQVSEKHCGFVINKGGATANDIIKLIGMVRQKVYEKFNVTLEPEVVILGEDIKEVSEE